MRVLVAGATGAIGRPLIEALLAAGHEVIGTSRKQEGAQRLVATGAEATILDAMDEAAVREAVRLTKPQIIIDQLTSLPADPARLNEAGPKDQELRLVGGGHLFAAAREFGVQRYIQQSCAFLLEASDGLADETSPLRTNAPGNVGTNATMYANLEHRCFSSNDLEGVALRVGFFYGPGTWYWPDGGAAEAAQDEDLPVVGGGGATWSFVHVDDVAAGTVAALTAPAGIYNLVDDDPVKVSRWVPEFSRWIGAPAPAHLAADSAVAEAVYYHQMLSGASNHKSKEFLGFQPRRLAWLQ